MFFFRLLLVKVMFYSTKIFEMAKMSPDGAKYATLGMGTLNVIMTLISLFLVELSGRKTLLLIGFSAMFVDTVLLTIALMFAVSIKTTFMVFYFVRFKRVFDFTVVRLGVLFCYPVRNGVRGLVRRRTGFYPVVLGVRIVQLVRPTISHQYSRWSQLDS